MDTLPCFSIIFQMEIAFGTFLFASLDKRILPKRSPIFRGLEFAHRGVNSFLPLRKSIHANSHFWSESHSF